MDITTKRHLFAFIYKHPIGTEVYENKIGLYLKVYTKRSDLDEIIATVLNEELIEENGLRKMNKQELIEFITADIDIMKCFIEICEREVEHKTNYNTIEIQDTLMKLSLEGHDLMYKHYSTWDEQDYRNYHALLIEAGKAERLYALYDNMTEHAEIYNMDESPLRFFNTQEEVENEYTALITAREYLKKEITIVPIIKAI